MNESFLVILEGIALYQKTKEGPVSIDKMTKHNHVSLCVQSLNATHSEQSPATLKSELKI